MQKKELTRNFIWNTLGSGFNSFNSLFFLIIVTRINGINNAGIFTLCYTTSLIIYNIACYSGRTYQVTENNKDINDNVYIKHRFICGIISIIITFLIGFILKYNQLKYIILIELCLYKIIDSISDVYYGILQKNNRLDIVGKSMFFKSLLGLILFLVIDIITNNIILSSLTLIITNLLFLILVDRKTGIKYKEKTKIKNNLIIKDLFLSGFFQFATLTLMNYIYNIPKYAIDGVLSDDMQAIYGIIIMPATIIMLINSFIIQPLITILKDSYNNHDLKKFNIYILKISLITLLVGLLSEIGAYFLGIPILELLYNISLENYLYSLLIIILGATLYTITSVLSNALVVMRKTKIQLLIYILVMIISIILSNILVKNYLFNGAIYSYLLMTLLLLISYFITYKIILNKERK